MARKKDLNPVFETQVAENFSVRIKNGLAKKASVFSLGRISPSYFSNSQRGIFWGSLLSGTFLELLLGGQKWSARDFYFFFFTVLCREKMGIISSHERSHVQGSTYVYTPHQQSLSQEQQCQQSKWRKGWGFSSSHTKNRNDLMASVPQLAPTEIYIGSTDHAVQNGF